MKYREIVIDGIQIAREQTFTGIPRVCRELLLRIDKFLDNEPDLKVSYAFSKNSAHKLIPLGDLKNIQPIEIEPENIYRAQIFCLPKLIKKRKALPVRLSFDLLFAAKNQIALIHDMRPLVFKRYDSLKFRLKYKADVNMIKRKAKLILTCSEYQKNSICKYTNRNRCDVKVVYWGWEHMSDIEPDYSLFDKYSDIKKGEYFFSLGNLALNKNFKWVIEVAKRNPDKTFVIAGGIYLENWREYYGVDELKNVLFVGFVSDEQNKALMSNCKAFLYPSKYEGFGIPPLEALACGARIIVSNATCLPEIYEDSANYFDPDDYDVDLEKLFNEPVASPDKILKKCSWDLAAMQFISLFKEYGKMN